MLRLRIPTCSNFHKTILPEITKIVINNISTKTNSTMIQSEVSQHRQKEKDGQEQRSIPQTRHNHNQKSRKNEDYYKYSHRHKRESVLQPPTIITNQFSSVLTKRQTTKHYNVHAPLCTCNKVLQLTKLLSESKDSKDSVQSQYLNGLLVIPESKEVTCIYHCQETSTEIFNKNPMSCEVKLKNEIFPKLQNESEESAEGDTEIIKQEHAKIKLRCAVCLLKQHEPNGFIAIHSLSFNLLLEVKRKIDAIAMKKKQLNIFHSDHCHETCILPKHLLWSIYINRKNKEKVQELTKVIIDQMIEQGIPNLNSEEFYTITLQHHLKFMLGLISKKQPYDSVYILLIYYRDSKSKIAIDLSGGKRHLGETSWQCAVRETEEEMSLVMNENDTWNWNIVESLNDRNLRENMYFMLNPVAKMDVEKEAKELSLEQLKL